MLLSMLPGTAADCVNLTETYGTYQTFETLGNFLEENVF